MKAKGARLTSMTAQYPSLINNDSSSPSLFDFLHLFADLNHEHVLCLDSIQALRLTSSVVRDLVDEHFPMKAMCPGGEVQAFCSHKIWASSLRHVVLCALYGSNCDSADVAAFSALEMPRLTTLEVQSMHWRYASHIFLDQGSWPNLTSLSLGLRSHSTDILNISLCPFHLPRAAKRWPLQELELTFNPGRIPTPQAEVQAAVLLIGIFSGLKKAKIVGDVRKLDLERVLEAGGDDKNRHRRNLLAEGLELEVQQLPLLPMHPY